MSMASPLGLSLLLAFATAVSAHENAYPVLVNAINQANVNARGCKAKTGFGNPVALDLTNDVTLNGPLPALLRGAVLIINGKCGPTGTQRCIIDGNNKYPIFSSSTLRILQLQGQFSKIRVNNLVFQNAVGGVFVRMWAEVQAVNSIFTGNKGGVEIGETNSPSGNPPRYFVSCQFVNNTGSVIHADNGLYGLASGTVGYSVKQSAFVGNTGVVGQDGGAVVLSGAGTSIFENVIFRSNTAYGSGGAISATATTVVFRRTSFLKNVAMKGQGGAVFGATSDDGDFSASFCSSTFLGNMALTDPNGATMSFFVANPGLDQMSLTFCDSPLAPGTRLPQRSIANVLDNNGQTSCIQTC